MNEIHISEIKSFRNKYIFHLVICSILIIFNFILLSKIIWIKNLFYILYLAFSYFSILYFIIPVLSLFLALLKKLNKKNIPKLRLFCFIFCVLAITIGLFLSIILMINTIEFPEFFRECPFNMKIKDINNKSFCNNRICILNYENKENIYRYEYLCNLEPSKYFDEKGPFKRSINESFNIQSDYQIECEKYDDINNYIIKNDIINRYINLCFPQKDLYICKRFNKPKYFKIKENYKCPEDNYSNNLYIFCVLNIFINLVLSFIPWRIEIVSYDKIILPLRRINRVSNSLNSTIDNSKIDEESKKESFKKVPTQVIIISNNSININEINNVNNINNNNEIENGQYIHTENSNHIFLNEILNDNISSKKINNKNKDNEKKINKTYDKEINNNISSQQNSAEIFILEDNKKINKKKNKNSKLNNDG